MADLHHKPTDCCIDISGLDDGYEDDDDDDGAKASGISLPEVTCLCCYDVLLDPTTLSCGHSFCRHCLAVWVTTSRKTTCPTCRRIWHSFPQVNISFRDLVEKHFQADVSRRRQSITADPRVARSLQVLRQAKRVIRCRVAPPPVRWYHRLGQGEYFSELLVTLAFTAVVFLVYHWSAGDLKVEHLVKKPLAAWTPDQVAMWMENLGTWTSPYRDIFIREQVNGRLLNALGEQDLLKPPYGIENELHRRALLKEVLRVQEVGFKQPQNLWEYKAVNGGRTLFLLSTMAESPRLSILYMFFFDYHDSFLPFIHASCPSAQKKKSSGDDPPFRDLDSPDWRQWLSFSVQFCLLPYQLCYDFVWNWQDVHYWTSCLVMWHCFILTLREGQILWNLRKQSLRRIPNIFFYHVCMLGALLFPGLLFWNILHQFFWDCLFYCFLYILPFTTTIIVLFPSTIKQCCQYLVRCINLLNQE